MPTATASIPAPAAPKAPGAPKAGRPPTGLLALTVVLAITTLVFGWMALAPSTAPIKTETTRQAATGGDEQAIADVASRFTQNFLTYRASTVDSDLAEAREDATEDFATKQIAAVGNKTLNQISGEIKAKNATSSLVVKGVAITSLDDETATVLVVGERTIASSERRGPEVELLVVQLTLLNDDGWKVDDATPATRS